MEYQEKQKTLLQSFVTCVPNIKNLAILAFYGNNTRVDTPFYTAPDGRKVRLTVYRPEEFVDGIEVGVRILMRTHRGSFHYKIIFIPSPTQIWKDKEPFQDISWEAFAGDMKSLFGLDFLV